MSTPTLADDSVTAQCIECGAAISLKAKFCLQCGASQAKATPPPIKCVGCGAEIPQVAKFCEECGASQNREDKSIQMDEAVSSEPELDEVPSLALEGSTVNGIETNSFQVPLSPSPAANHTSNPTRA